MDIKTPYDIAQSVYLKTDKEKNERIVTGISIRENGATYALSCGDKETWHYECEITKEAPTKSIGFNSKK